MARLRVASPAEGQPEQGFADAARAALEKALADGVLAICILYETPAERDFVAIPGSVALAQGLVRMQAFDFDPPPVAD
jgi:hypothetical protein